MTRRCIVHIGCSKTGSSALQSALHSSSKALLRDHGIGYCPDYLNHGALTEFTDPTPDPENYVRKRYRVLDATADAFALRVRDDFERHFRLGNSRIEVISGEGFGQRQSIDSVERLKSFLTPHFDDIRIVAYVRPFSAWLNSRGQQRIKSGSTFEDIRKSTELFISGREPGEDDRLHSLNPAVEKWFTPYLEVFGSEAMTIRNAERGALVGGDIVEDFTTRFLGKTPEQLGLTQNNENESLSRSAAHVMEAINRHVPKSMDGRPNPARATGLVSLMKAYPFDAKFVVPGVRWAEYKQAQAENAQWLFDVTGGEVDFRDEPLPVCDESYAIPEELEALAVLLNDQRRQVEISASRLRIQKLWPEVLNAAPDSIPTDHPLVIHARRLADPDEMLRIANRLRRKGHLAAARMLADTVRETAIDSDKVRAAEGILSKLEPASRIVAKS